MGENELAKFDVKWVDSLVMFCHSLNLEGVFLSVFLFCFNNIKSYTTMSLLSRIKK